MNGEASNSSACQLGIKFYWLLLAMLLSAPAAAKPDLQQIITIDGVTLVRDHQNHQVFYYLKSHKKLAVKNGMPDFNYAVNRYLGKQQTGDEGEFRVRGVIKFSVITSFIDTDYKQLTEKLEARYGGAITLKAAPIKDSFNRLVYATIEGQENQKFEGVLEGGHDREEFKAQAENSTGRIFGSAHQRFTIGLAGKDANLFWENFARDNLSLSLAYGWTIDGVILDKNDQWVPSSYQVNDSLPIDVSIQKYPGLFTKNELWQNLQFAYTKLKIMCYDFINLEKTDLYYVNVEVRFKTMRDRNYVEEVKFTADGDLYERDISFELANDIKDGYQYRVRRLTSEGEMIRSKWQHSKTPWLDVSLSGAELGALENSIDEEQNP